jgi:imidazolonepropionase-like amidohydrolase
MRNEEMHRIRIIACLFAAGMTALFLSSLTNRIQAQATPAVVALVGGRVIASADALPVDDATVLIQGGRIANVGPRERVTVPVGAKTIDCRNLVVVAGFQNSHVHFTEEQWTDAGSQPPAKLAEQLRTMLTAYGFSTVVDTGSLLPNTVALRRRIEIDKVPGPRILTAGLPLYPPSGIPYYVKDSVPPDLLKLLPQPSTPKEAESAVIQNIDGGSDIIKLFTGSWVTNQQVLPMPADLAAAAVQAAHRRGRLVFAHVSSVPALEVTLSAGVDVIAHALDETRGRLTPEHLRRMRRQNVTLIPTLTLFADLQNTAEVFREVVDYASLGGEILFGTDVGYHQMYNSELEYQLLAKAGLSWRQVLASLTTSPARRFNEGNRRGQLKPGMDGDVVVLGADPSKDPQAFTDIRYTIRSGEVIYQRAVTR